MGKDVNAPFEKDGHEYGNYDKYHKQQVNINEDDGNLDDGTSQFFKNYQKMLKNMAYEELDQPNSQKKENIEETIQNYKLQSNVAVDELNAMNGQEDYRDQIFQQE